MRINENTRLVGEKVILIPYRPHHVPKYHDWMSRDEIQQLTCSEPLTLEQEYEMQASWRNDPDKLTFIILKKDLWDRDESTRSKEEKEIAAMIGDVNCFIIDEEDQNGESVKAGELEIMIVDKENRGLGLGIESMRLMISYCMEFVFNDLMIKQFMVKIDEANLASIRMFEKLGFVQFKYSSVFKQVSLRLHSTQSIYKLDYKIDLDY